MAYTESQKKAIDTYRKKQKQIALVMPPDEYDMIRAAAEAEGQSMQGYILNIIRKQRGE